MTGISNIVKIRNKIAIYIEIATEVEIAARNPIKRIREEY
tara:strand:+ start:66 stop:185 length:120 start_codon:yes stop_codon:yes gene_type:complete